MLVLYECGRVYFFIRTFHLICLNIAGFLDHETARIDINEIDEENCWFNFNSNAMSGSTIKRFKYIFFLSSVKTKTNNLVSLFCV